MNYNDKVNKYQRACNTNGVSFLPFIMEFPFYPFLSNGFIHPTSKLFLEDLAKQASFFRHMPWSNTLLAPLLAILSDADISTYCTFILQDFCTLPGIYLSTLKIIITSLDSVRRRYG